MEIEKHVYVNVRMHKGEAERHAMAIEATMQNSHDVPFQYLEELEKYAADIRKLCV